MVDGMTVVGKKLAGDRCQSCSSVCSSAMVSEHDGCVAILIDACALWY